MENRLREVGLEEVRRRKRVAGIFRLQSTGLKRKNDLEGFLGAFGCEIFIISIRLVEI